jgi:hypothetical protein
MGDDILPSLPDESCVRTTPWLRAPSLEGGGRAHV